jgi:hypothetical protein
MFLDENNFRENSFFSVFGYISKNAPKNILQCYVKDITKGAGVRRAFLENCLRKNWA